MLVQIIQAWLFQVGASPVELSTDTTRIQHVNEVLANH